MRARLKLKPGQRGTKKLVAKYGERLVCVRYRYDAATQKRYKTVELIEDAADWRPGGRRTPESVVPVRILYHEAELRATVKRAGGRWRPDVKLWDLPYAKAVELGLEARIVDTTSI